MIIALTGAGISAPSGIPTFSQQPGIREYLTRSFADRHPAEFRKVMADMLETCRKAEPNDAHIALAERRIPVVTMNIDGLHKRAGSEKVLQIHGSLFDGNVVLYGDPAPLYSEAMSWIGRLGPGDMLLVVGTSYYTDIASRLKALAEGGGAKAEEIGSEAEVRVRALLDASAGMLEPFEDFVRRTDEYVPPMPRPYGTGGWEIP